MLRLLLLVPVCPEKAPLKQWLIMITQEIIAKPRKFSLALLLSETFNTLKMALRQVYLTPNLLKKYSFQLKKTSN